MAIRTLLVGINTYPEHPLRGCVPDVLSMRDVLRQRYGVDDDHMRVLTDAAATRDGIVDGLRWLAQTDDGESDPVRLFHFSGHGARQADQNGDEPDGRDECIVPYDYATVGYMTDDVLHEIYEGFSSSGHLLLVMDSCHSGGSQRDVDTNITYRFLQGSPEEEAQLDQDIQAAAARNKAQRDQYVDQMIQQTMREPWQRDPNDPLDDEELQRFNWGRKYDEDHYKQYYGQNAIKGNTVLLAACQSNQCAADAKFGDAYNGALTYFLTKTLASSDAPPTYAALIDQVQTAMIGLFVQQSHLECDPAWEERPFLSSAVGERVVNQ
jgi:hypothetical protein